MVKQIPVKGAHWSISLIVTNTMAQKGHFSHSYGFAINTKFGIPFDKNVGFRFPSSVLKFSSILKIQDGGHSFLYLVMHLINIHEFSDFDFWNMVNAFTALQFQNINSLYEKDSKWRPFDEDLIKIQGGHPWIGRNSSNAKWKTQKNAVYYCTQHKSLPNCQFSMKSIQWFSNIFR